MGRKGEGEDGGEEDTEGGRQREEQWRSNGGPVEKQWRIVSVLSVCVFVCVFVFVSVCVCVGGVRAYL